MKLDDFMARLSRARRGTDYVKGCCVFHPDEDPSLVVYSDNRFYCFGCGMSGSWSVLWDALEGPVIRVAEKQGSSRPHFRVNDLEEYILSAHRTLKHVSQFQYYIEQRKVMNMLDTAKLGWDEHWYILPVLTRDGHAEGVVARADGWIQETYGSRFDTPPRQRPLMYVPDWKLMDGEHTLFLVYGMFDALSVASCGYPAVTTTAGKDSFDHTWLDEYRCPIILLPDTGEDGTAMELSAKLGWRSTVHIIDYPEGTKDPADLHVAGVLSGLLGKLSRRQ